jgi:hypothetical protein
MNANPSRFLLNIQQVDQTCLFELSWGQGQSLRTQLDYPASLTQAHQQWQQAYLSFYKKALRGKAVGSGTFGQAKVDWHARLVQAEAHLLYEFHRWLRQEPLYELRATLARAAIQAAGREPVDVFVVASPVDVARLPWEVWELGTEFGARERVRIVRSPATVRTAVTLPQRRTGRNRVLAILGDDTGLDFAADRAAITALTQIAEVVFVGWQPGHDLRTLKAEIVEAIADPRGWDVLLFAGHSNETLLTGGELAIAPGLALTLHELQQPLRMAMHQGLQFALFNSCYGLSVANTLVDWGMGQVAVMREPIHNQVAQEFLVRFLQELAQFHDTHAALLAAGQFLKLEKHLTYPSASLVPSLFRHPDAPPFRLRSVGWRQCWQCLRPTRWEAIAIAILAVISWQLPVQGWLLEQRLLMQALYRHATAQLPPTQPPTLIVQIDNESIRRANLADPQPMDRVYLSQLVRRVHALGANIIGIDYLLDRPQVGRDQQLSAAIAAAVQDQRQLVFATLVDRRGDPLAPLPSFAQPEWSLLGDITLFSYGDYLRYVSLLSPTNRDLDRVGLPYWLALLDALPQWDSNIAPRPPLPADSHNADPRNANPHSSDPETATGERWGDRLVAWVEHQTGHPFQQALTPRAEVSPLTNLSYGLGQVWLSPIFDFSLPPNRVYQALPAWQLLDPPAPGSPPFDPHHPPIVLIAAGGYGSAGITSPDEDNYIPSAATRYWRSYEPQTQRNRILTGGEAHAYAIHHFRYGHLVIPVPDFWMVLLAAIAGKAITRFWLPTLTPFSPGTSPGTSPGMSPGTSPSKTIRRRLQWGGMIAGVPLGFTWLSAQIFVSANLLIPIALPLATVGSYLVLARWPPGRSYPRSRQSSQP